MYTYVYIYKCSLRSHEERISNTHREEEDADKRADAYPHANMLRTRLPLPQHTYPYKTYIPTYKPSNPTNPTNYQPITPAYPTNSTLLQPLRPYSTTTYKFTLQTLQLYYCAVRSRLPLFEYCTLRMSWRFLRMDLFESLLK